jgi:O-antigen/teichoic acid export membrane protein
MLPGFLGEKHHRQKYLNSKARIVRQLFSRIFRSAVGWSFVATALKFGSALLVLPLVLRRIPPEELGLWYVFLSFGALVMLVDFGFAQTVSRVTAYLWAGARELHPYGLASIEPQDETTSRSPAEANLPLLSRVIAALRIYYFALGSTAFLLLLGVGGWWIYSKTQTFPNAHSLRIAFVVYALAVALNLAGNMWLYTLTGINRVRESLQLSVFCQLENYAIAITGLLGGFRLWALVVANFAMGVTERLTGRFLFYKYAPIEKAPFDSGMLRLLWPNAWRTGIVSVATFMGLQANTLICSGFLGLKVTASYGLTLQAVMLLVGVSSVWVAVKFPLINQLRSQGRLQEIANLFRQRIALGILTYLFGGSLLLFLGPRLLTLLHAKTQLISTPLLVAMLLIYLLEAHHSLYASLVFSENVNPFVVPAIISGTAIVALSVLLTPRIGVWGMLLAQGVVQLCFNNWWPVVRGIRGLSINPSAYWWGFLDWTGGPRPSGN